MAGEIALALVLLAIFVGVMAIWFHNGIGPGR